MLYWGSFAIINSAAAICWELYLACFAVTNSTVNCLVMHLPWWTKPLWQLLDNILSAFTAHKCTALHKQKHDCQPAGTVPWVCLAERMQQLQAGGDVLKLFCNHELSSYKLILALYLDYFVHSLPIHGQIHTSKTNNCQPAGTVPCMIAVPGARTVNHMVLGWNCVAIMNSTAANCLTLYLACFAVRNSTANCSVMCLPWPYSKCIHCL